MCRQLPASHWKVFSQQFSKQKNTVCVSCASPHTKGAEESPTAISSKCWYFSLNLWSKTEWPRCPRAEASLYLLSLSVFWCKMFVLKTCIFFSSVHSLREIWLRKTTDWTARPWSCLTAVVSSSWQCMKRHLSKNPKWWCHSHYLVWRNKGAKIQNHYLSEQTCLFHG